MSENFDRTKSIIEPIQSALRHAKASIDIAESEKEEWDIREIERRGALHNLEELAVAVRQAVDQLGCVPYKPIDAVKAAQSIEDVFPVPTRLSLAGALEYMLCNGAWISLSQEQGIEAISHLMRHCGVKFNYVGGKKIVILEEGVDAYTANSTIQKLFPNMVLVGMHDAEKLPSPNFEDFVWIDKRASGKEQLGKLQSNSPKFAAALQKWMQELTPRVGRIPQSEQLKDMLNWLQQEDDGAAEEAFKLAQQAVAFANRHGGRYYAIEQPNSFGRIVAVVCMILDGAGSLSYQQASELCETILKGARKQGESRHCSCTTRCLKEGLAPGYFCAKSSDVEQAAGIHYSPEGLDLLAKVENEPAFLRRFHEVEAKLQTAQSKLDNAMARAREACGTSEPSGTGRDWVDELAGLLSVARSQRDTIDKSAKAIAELLNKRDHNLQSIMAKAQSACGYPTKSTEQNDWVDELIGLLKGKRHRNRVDQLKGLAAIMASEPADPGDVGRLMNRVTELEQEIATVQRKARRACEYDHKGGDGDWVDEIIGLYEAARQIKSEDSRRMTSLTSELVKTRELRDQQVSQLEGLIVTAKGTIDSLKKDCEQLRKRPPTTEEVLAAMHSEPSKQWRSHYRAMSDKMKPGSRVGEMDPKTRLLESLCAIIDYGCVCDEHEESDPPHWCPACLALDTLGSLARVKDLVALSLTRGELFKTIEKILNPISEVTQDGDFYTYRFNGKEFIQKDGPAMTLGLLRKIHLLSPEFNVYLTNMAVREHNTWSQWNGHSPIDLALGVWEFTTRRRPDMDDRPPQPDRRHGRPKAGELNTAAYIGSPAKTAPKPPRNRKVSKRRKGRR